MSSSNYSGKIDTVIFDFDGTIANSGGIFLETLEEVLNIPKLTKKEVEDLRGLSTREIIKKLGIKKWQIPRLATKGRRRIAQKMGRVEIFKGMPEAINTILEKDFRLYLLSSNSKEAVVGFLSRYGLEHTMSNIYTGTSLFGKAKRLKSLLRKEQLVKAECVYIGDETRDIEAAKQLNMKCIAVEWGYSSPAALKSYHPDAMVANPGELAKAILALEP